MKYLIGAALIFFSLITFSQGRKLTDEQLNSSGAKKLMFVRNIQEVDALAKKDIYNNMILLLLQSGEAPVTYTTDDLFEEKFQAKYLESGCIGPTLRFAKEYNLLIFKYLSHKYGKKWMKDIRKDVPGLKEFKRNNSLPGSTR